jgi:hypothetical protein
MIEAGNALLRDHVEMSPSGLVLLEYGHLFLHNSVIRSEERHIKFNHLGKNYYENFLQNTYYIRENWCSYRWLNT